ncbi:MAG: hypothetical protein V3S14_16225, partial [Anaerolineae bacterium]
SGSSRVTPKQGATCGCLGVRHPDHAKSQSHIFIWRKTKPSHGIVVAHPQLAQPQFLPFL